jgi:hypothetical protein
MIVDDLPKECCPFRAKKPDCVFQSHARGFSLRDPVRLVFADLRESCAAFYEKARCVVFTQPPIDRT